MVRGTTYVSRTQGETSDCALRLVTCDHGFDCHCTGHALEPLQHSGHPYKATPAL